MPVTPNIQILRIFEKRPFSTPRKRKAHRSQSQQSATRIRIVQSINIIDSGDTPVTTVDSASSELNVQPQTLEPEPPRSPLRKLQRKTSKWFANRRATKTARVASDSHEAPLRPAIKTQAESQVESQEEAPKAFKAVHFDGAPEYIEDSFSLTPSFGSCPQWVGIRSTIYYSFSDSAENLSDPRLLKSRVQRAPRRKRSGLPEEYCNVVDTGSSSDYDNVFNDSPLSPRSTGLTPSGPNLSPNSTSVAHSNPKERPVTTPVSLDEALKKFPVKENTLNFKPTRINTIEDISAFKIYMETFYNERYTESKSERSVRRQRLQAHLDQSSLSPSEKNEIVHSWERSESTHLRRLRGLKSSSGQRHSTKSVSNAGFQELRILGKGSFGAVKLVTDAEHFLTEESTPCVSNDVPCPTLVRRGSQDPRAMKDYYAMKVIRKASMIRKGQEAHMRGERDFLVKAEGSQWVVPLIASFQDSTNLYLVMEFMIGADFMTYLIRRHVISEDDTRFFIAEMVLAIEETHKMGWIHRDIKPDNFLIHSSGHLKICDFGLAFDGHWSHINDYYDTTRWSILDKYNIHVRGDALDQESRAHPRYDYSRASTSRRPYEMHSVVDMKELLEEPERVQRERPKSNVGTKLYMAPELVLGHDYDGRIDWWSLGCILFECFWARTPFYSEYRQTTAKNIVTLHFSDSERLTGTGQHFPAPSKSAVSLMKGLLREKQYRLSSAAYSSRSCHSSNFQDTSRELPFVVPNDAEEIKAHPFFKPTQWDSLHRSKPPFVPEVVEDIAQYFDDEDKHINAAGTSFMSLRERADPEGRSWTNKQVLGEYYERWVAEQLQVEKIQMGMTDWTDERFEKHKRMFGDRWCALKETRMKHVRAARIRRGINPDEEVKHLLGSRVRRSRPKDMLLRDRHLGDHVLERRKAGAFLGYTYRCPRYVFPEAGKEKAPVFSRPTIIPVTDNE
ncbi:kinase-like protein [Aureobasidium subglaciale]|nr:kinase-like protein [Aureobasidium subglaciale]